MGEFSWVESVECYVIKDLESRKWRKQKCRLETQDKWAFKQAGWWESVFCGSACGAECYEQ